MNRTIKQKLCDKCPMDTGGLGIAYTKMNSKIITTTSQATFIQYICSNPDCRYIILEKEEHPSRRHL